MGNKMKNVVNYFKNRLPEVTTWLGCAGLLAVIFGKSM